MKKIYKPQLLLGTITLPQIIICIVFYRIFNIINSELSKEGIKVWMNLSLFLIGACIILTIYGIVLWRRKRDIHPISALITLVLYCFFLYIYVMKYNSIIPQNISNWMLLGIDPNSIILTLLMPALVHSMLILVNFISEKRPNQNFPREILILIGIPAFWYILINLSDHMDNVIKIVFIMSMVAFIFFLVKISYGVIKKKPDIWHRYLAPVVFLGSLCGLMLNQNIGNLFGDFSHWSFYILNIITCSLMLIPPLEDKKKRLIVFMFKSITFIFTVYFFVVFLPLFPLALVGMIIFGLGVLILVPSALMLIHVRSLWCDFNYLKSFYKIKYLASIFLVGIILIPSMLMLTIYEDKPNLNKALKFTYQRAYEDKEDIDIDLASIKRSLTNIKYIKGIRRTRRAFMEFNRDIPYITSFYNQYVLDGLSLSNEKINKLERIFFGESNVVLRNEAEASEDVVIEDIKTETKYDSKTSVYRSWIDMEIKNHKAFQGEYSTVFKLPEGSYISNYYLYVGNIKKYGLIADKRAANWIYKRIKTIRKDPGLLSYIGDNKISFRIFPFEGNQRRKTGIEIIHRRPIAINIDGNEIELEGGGKDYLGREEINLNSNVIYVTKEMKDTLPKINRNPRYHFLIDYSKGNEENISNYADRIKEYIEKNNIDIGDVKEITALNYREKQSTLDSDWEKEFQDIEVEAGLFLEHTIKRILYESYVKGSDEYPVIILAADDFHKAVISKDIKDYKFALPEGVYCYQLDRRGRLVKHLFNIQALRHPGEIVSEPVAPAVLKWEYGNDRTYYLADDKEDSIVLINHDFEAVENELQASKWHDGALLKGAYNSSLLHPEKYFMKSLSIVKNSIMNEVMTPLTSFIVLENEAQEKVMLEKQKKILATKKPLDIGDVREMDEPPLLIIIFLLIIFTIFLKRRRKLMD